MVNLTHYFHNSYISYHIFFFLNTSGAFPEYHLISELNLPEETDVSNERKRIDAKRFNRMRLCLLLTSQKKLQRKKIWKCSLVHLES